LSAPFSSTYFDTKTDAGFTPMSAACEDVVQWLILEGAANNDDGHVDRAILQRDVQEQARPDLHSYFKLLVN
jgi:hypothetical protein